MRGPKTNDRRFPLYSTTPSKKVLMVGFALVASLVSGCGPSAAPRPASAAGGVPGRVTVSGTQFLDGAGKPLLLHGINVVNKSKTEGYTGGIERADFAAIRSWGMNCVRLGILVGRAGAAAGQD